MAVAAPPLAAGGRRGLSRPAQRHLRRNGISGATGKPARAKPLARKKKKAKKSTKKKTVSKKKSTTRKTKRSAREPSAAKREKKKAR
jgi:hypothetical protein